MYPKYTPPGGGGGSKWYAPMTGAPATLPVASGTNALSAGNAATSTNTNGIAFGTSANCGSIDGLAIGRSSNANPGGNYAVGPYCNATGGDALAYGYNCTASNTAAAAVGFQCTASGASTAAFGRFAFATASASSVFGSYSTASGLYSTTLGFSCTAAHLNSLAVQQGVTLNQNEIMRGDFDNGAGVTLGSIFTPLSHLVTTDGAANNMPGFAIPNTSSATFSGKIAAYRTAGGGVVGDSAGWIITGLVKQVAGVTTYVGGIVGVAGAPNFNDAGAAAWTVALAIIAGKLTPAVTGQAAETIKWECSLEFTANN